MTLSILQNEPIDPTPDQLVAAFESLPRLTNLDAQRRAEDACGVLADHLDEEDAPVLLAALAEQGVPASIVDNHTLPPLPTPFRSREAHPEEDELLVFDSHNNVIRVEWSRVTIVAAGMIGKTDLHTQVATRFQRVGPAISSYQDRRTTESRHVRPFVEVYLDHDPWRVRFEVDNFRFTYLVNTAPQNLIARYERLVTDLARHAGGAQINRGADAIVRSLPHRVYRSMQVFEREVRWLHWISRITKGNH